MLKSDYSIKVTIFTKMMANVLLEYETSVIIIMP